MATFQYIALDGAGQEKRGTIEAGDRASAIAAIRAHGLFPSAIGEVKGAPAPAAKAAASSSGPPAGASSSGSAVGVHAVGGIIGLSTSVAMTVISPVRVRWSGVWRHRRHRP